MAEADKVEDDENLRKKLGLMIAKHVVEQEKRTKRENIRKAIAFLKETEGFLKIEDRLPFFPDSALIDDFKESICSSLEDYNRQIEQLKQQLSDAWRRQYKKRYQCAGSTICSHRTCRGGEARSVRRKHRRSLLGR